MRDKGVSQAFIYHLQWRTQLRDFMDGKGDFDVAEISPEGCSFGKWLRCDEIKQDASTPEIQELVSTHDDLHKIAERVYDLKMLGQDNAARQELRKVVKASLKLYSLLGALNIIKDNQGFILGG
jgi:Chemoreceptor zinc-binding domain